MENNCRLIDANELWHKTFSCDEVAEVRKFIEQALTVDAVEVVRCKDCKKWLKVEPSGTNCRYCAISTRSRLPYDFCSYGERRSGE